MKSLQKRKAELAKIELGCELLRQKLNAPPEVEKPNMPQRRTTLYSRHSTTSEFANYGDWEDEYDDYAYSPLGSPSPRDSLRRSKEKTDMWRQKESFVLARKLLASVQLEEENAECESEESEIFTASSGSSKGSVASKKKTSKTKVSSHEYHDTIARKLILIRFDLVIYR